MSPNAVHPPGSGTTALHLAASLSRTDVVLLLLDQEGIDDSLRDSEGKTCLEVARGKETIRAIRGQFHRLIDSDSCLLMLHRRLKSASQRFVSFSSARLHRLLTKHTGAGGSRQAAVYPTDTTGEPLVPR